ncbi:hypothetical protein [Aurantimicrobium minutum]|nr:hypothetical protein [Aurantimicrobium minutum]
MAGTIRPDSALAQACESLTEEEREEILALSEDSSYVTPRVMSHLKE